VEREDGTTAEFVGAVEGSDEVVDDLGLTTEKTLVDDEAGVGGQESEIAVVEAEVVVIVDHGSSWSATERTREKNIGDQKKKRNIFSS
jgi:hypothetical protein